MSGRGSTLDLSILGDAEEQHRIQLEQNLQQTDISLHLSSPRNDYSHIEHPRHHSDPYSFSGIASFDRSREALEASIHSSHRAWSYHVTEDDGYNPYVGETISTAAHHASALTLSAGLGGRAHRRDVSLSGAEYDPDRPVQGVVAGLNRKSGGRDFSYSIKPKQVKSATVGFDPLVVDDTAEIDQMFQTYRSEGISGLQSPPMSSSSASSMPQEVANSPRPKLSDALHRATFSPKRPRSAQATPSHRSSRSVRKSDHPLNSLPARERSHQSLSYGVTRPSLVDEPTVNIHPPTPSQASSKFTRLAKGITADIQAESQVKRTSSDKFCNAPQSTVRKRPPTLSKPTQSPFKDAANQTRVPSDGDRNVAKHSGQKLLGRSRVHLPDVTGLTSAIQSPSKLGVGYFIYDSKEDTQIEARLMATLSVVQSKLSYLEAENSISRRRVRELERELEQCKKDVAKERTRVIDQDVSSHSANDVAGDAARYREAVEARKALEALVLTLQTHLSRLTSELSEHGQLLAELRALREQDVAALQEKSGDVDRLKEEVERLSGEVEVLRGVIEEGLRERREVKEHSIVDTSGTSGEGASCSGLDGRSDDQNTSPEVNPQAKPYVNAEELDRISVEVEERRSERSMSRSVGSTARYRDHKSGVEYPTHSPLPEPCSPDRKLKGRSLNSTDVHDDLLGFNAPSVNAPTSPVRNAASITHVTPNRDAAGVNHITPDKATTSGQEAQTEDIAPFPTIRGSRMEKLFFAARHHDSHTCALCHRRRKPSPSGITAQKSPTMSQDLDQAYDTNHRGGGLQHNGRSINEMSSEHALPPQTVLARVLRELEDDFTHYKAIYVELADQYRVMDAASNVAKRHVLAQHVHEIVDTLERKGDQIASLYKLLSYRDQDLPRPL